MKRTLIAVVLGLAFLSCEVSNPVAPPSTPAAGDGSGSSGSAGSGSPDFTIVITIASGDQETLEIGGDAVDITIEVTQAAANSPGGLAYSVSTNLGALLDPDDSTFKQLIDGVLQGAGTKVVVTTKFKPGDQAGTADVLVNVGNTIGTAQFEIIVPVPVEPAVADFAVQQSDRKVLFTSSATGTEPINHRWDFGDGCAWVETGTDDDGLAIGDCVKNEDDTSIPGCSDCAASDPVHDYATPGAYAIKLVVQNQPNKTDDKTQLIDVGTLPTPDEPPVAMFTTEPQPGGLTVIFRDASTGPPNSWSWNFGDPASESNTSSLQNPVHPFSGAGEFLVSLTVANSAGSNTTSQFVPVGADIPELKADFTFVVSESGLIVTFTDTSTGSPDSYSWQFGDGGTSQEQNPIHEYLVANEYSVKLTVTGAGGAQSTAQKLVAAGAPPPTANFDWTPKNAPGVPNGLKIVFNDLSTGDPTTWSWDFKDGTTATCTAPDTTCRNPVHDYLISGSYGVTLVVSNSGGSNNITKLVEVDSGQTPPVSLFESSKLGGLTVEFDGSKSTGGNLSYLWDFGDTNSPDNSSENVKAIHTFSASDDYLVKLTVQNGEGTSVSSQTIQFAVPKADFGFRQNGTTGVFTDQSSGGPVKWTWTFADSAGAPLPSTMAQPNPLILMAGSGDTTYDFGAAGSYQVTLEIENGDGETDEITKGVTLTP